VEELNDEAGMGPGILRAIKEERDMPIARSEKDLAEMRRLVETGMPRKAVAERFGASLATLRKAVRGGDIAAARPAQNSITVGEPFPLVRLTPKLLDTLWAGLDFEQKLKLFEGFR
jgi:hypothetical protein